MLISTEKRNQIKEAINSGTLSTVLTPAGSRNLNPSQTQIVIPSSLGKIVPLTDSNGNRFTGNAMQCVAEAIRQKKLPATNNEYDHILNAPGELYKQYQWYNWVLTHFSYGKPDEKLGSQIKYTDGNGINYLVDVPKAFQDLINHALYLELGYFQKGEAYFQYDKVTIRKEDYNAVVFNSVDALISQNLLKAVPIHRKDGDYLVDAHGIPNGAASSDAAARHFYQVDDGTRTYAGLLGRGDDVQRGVGADWWPSYVAGVLVHE